MAIKVKLNKKIKDKSSRDIYEKLRNFLMNDKDCIFIEEAKRRTEKRWPRN